MKNLKITKNTNILELVRYKPELAGMLLSSGMGCVGCPMAQMETIEDGCKAHGMSDKDIDKFIIKLNKELNKSKKKLKK